MALVPIRIGVPVVQLSVDDPTVLPSMLAVQPTASAMAPAVLLNASVKSQLTLNVNYQFILGLVGRAANGRGGYSVGVCSLPTTAVQVTAANQGIALNITSANLPANYDKSICMAVFGKRGASSTYQLFEFAYIDPGIEFNHMVLCDALQSAPAFAATTLQTATLDPTLGPLDRAPLGVGYQSIAITTGGVQLNRDVSSVNVAPDNGPDYTLATSRSASIQFNSLANGIQEVVKAATGTYAQFPGFSGGTIEVAQQTILTAQAVLKGNRAIKLLMPVDNTGIGETRLYIGNLTLSQTAINENWQKAATTPIQFKLDTAAQDNLITSQFSEIIYRKT